MMKKNKTFIFTGLLLAGFGSSCFASLPVEILKTLGGKQPDYRVLAIKAPEIAENGGSVNIRIRKLLPLASNEYVHQLNIYSDFRKTRPIASFRMSPQNMVDDMKLRIRLRKTANVYVVARLNNGRVLAAEKKIKVTIGGCGGTVNASR